MIDTVTHTMSVVKTTAYVYSLFGFTLTPPIAALFGGVLSFLAALIAVGAVVWSQWQFDKRQALDHENSAKLKMLDHKKDYEIRIDDLIIEKKELLLNKLYEFIDLVLQSTQDIHKIHVDEKSLTEFNALTFSSIKKRNEVANLCKLYFMHLFEQYIHIQQVAEKYVNLVTVVIANKSIEHKDLIEHQLLAQELLKSAISFSNILIKDNQKNINKGV